MARSPKARSSSTDTRGFPKFWDEERETMSSDARDEIILDRIRHQLHYAYAELPFYREHYDRHGFKPDMVASLDDFAAKVPAINKKMLVADQAANPIFGSYTKFDGYEGIARIHGSSGTSGTPTMYAVSQRDWDRAAEVHAMAQWCAGVRPDDLVQVGFPFGLFFGGWGVVQGVEAIGAALFPLGVTDSEKHLDFIQRLKPTVFSATPSYCLHLVSVAAKMGISLRDSSVRTLLIGGEPGGSLPGTKRLLEEGWGAQAIDAGSTSEMYPFQTNVGCESGTGTHIISDEVYPEIVDPSDLNSPMATGARGALVYTHLWRESQPMIRFAPGDESFLDTSVCDCGRTYPRMPEGVLGRLDDMLLIRGANIFPSTIETCLRGVEGFDVEFEIHVTTVGALDEIEVRVEYDAIWLERQATDPAGRAAALAALASEGERTMKKVNGIRIPVTILEPGTLDRTVFKARRVVDRRAKR